MAYGANNGPPSWVQSNRVRDAQYHASSLQQRLLDSERLVIELRKEIAELKEQLKKAKKRVK